MTASIRVEHVTLNLPLDLQRGSAESASSLVGTFGGTIRREAVILSGIDFQAHEGDRIGVFGLNGAGKTTLLRVLNGAFPPTFGKVETRGSVQSLLNSTLGFHEYASVNENVFLRGTAMGLRKRQLEARLHDILDFAGLRDRSAHRLHTLSAGQRMRLGFAISTAIQPDILLMDEWLATGDAVFLARAQERMLDRFRDSRVVVLASHNTALLRAMCNKALVLDRGRMRFFGSIEDGIETYRGIVSGAQASVRQAVAGSDPVLFGNAVGLVERIRSSTGRIEIAGWAVAEQGGEIGALCVELDGQRHLFEQFERIERDDVRRHLAKKSGRYGFKVVLEPGPIEDPGTVQQRLQVSTGSKKTRLGAPLPLAVSAIVETE